MTVLLVALPREENFGNCKMSIKVNGHKECILKCLGAGQQGIGFSYHHFFSTQLLLSHVHLLSKLE